MSYEVNNIIQARWAVLETIVIPRCLRESLVSGELRESCFRVAVSLCGVW